MMSIRNLCLKAKAERSDPVGMVKDVACPICNADLPLTGDERVGDEIFCTYCGSPSRLTVKPKKLDDKDEYMAEEDY